MSQSECLTKHTKALLRQMDPIQRALPINADNGEYLNKEIGSYHTPEGPHLIKSPPRGLVHCRHISFTDKKSYF